MGCGGCVGGGGCVCVCVCVWGGGSSNDWCIKGLHV